MPPTSTTHASAKQVYVQDMDANKAEYLVDRSQVKFPENIPLDALLSALGGTTNASEMAEMPTMPAKLTSLEYADNYRQQDKVFRNSSHYFSRAQVSAESQLKVYEERGLEE